MRPITNPDRNGLWLVAVLSTGPILCLTWFTDNMSKHGPIGLPVYSLPPGGSSRITPAARGPVRFTRDEYYTLDRARFFRNQRVRLISGVLVQEPPTNPLHATGVRKATRALERVFS